ncbi:MAG: glycosyltransferase family 4 protein [Pseudomonadota bacterium]
MPTRPGVLIIVENLTVPLDSRVLQEAQGLRDAGYTVSVICPKAPSYPANYEVLDGIHIFRHSMPFEADGCIGYALEYGWALLCEAYLSVKVQWKVGFSVIQGCNPPDLIFLIAGVWKLLAGTKFVFDHHDINPELFEAKFGRKGWLHWLLTKFERATFQTADVSIATNDTFKKIAVERGKMAPEDVFVVRSIPDLSRFKRLPSHKRFHNNRTFVAGYLGIMGAQDGVDLFIEGMAHLIQQHSRHDIQAVIVGSGTELPKLRALAEKLEIEDFVTFTGFMSGQPLLEILSSFDIGIIPDPKNGYNDKISMNKIFEYMTLGIPFVQFDLIEGRAIAGDAALYAQNNSPIGLAEKIAALADDASLRDDLAAKGKARANRLLSWENERAALLAAYDRALAPQVEQAGVPAQL